MTDDRPVTRRRYQQMCLAAFTLADPKCKKPRPRLQQIRTMLEDNKIDLLAMARACLDEVEREGMPDHKRPAWRKQTKRAARILRAKRRTNTKP